MSPWAFFWQVPWLCYFREVYCFLECKCYIFLINSYEALHHEVFSFHHSFHLRWPGDRLSISRRDSLFHKPGSIEKIWWSGDRLSTPKIDTILPPSGFHWGGVQRINSRGFSLLDYCVLVHSTSSIWDPTDLVSGFDFT